MFSKGKIKNNIFNKFKAGLPGGIFQNSKLITGLPGSAFRNRKTTTGFSLVELIVSIGIFTVITSVVMFNYGRFESNMVVTNLAYEAALAVRQAQVYGISVKKTKTGPADLAFGAPYGVWFEEPAGTELNQKFYLFADKNKDNQRTVSGEGISIEDEEAFGMNGTNKIRNFCVTDSYGTETCSGNAFSSLSIIFTRPEPNAKIYTFDTGGGVVGSLYKDASIYLTSGRGDKVAKMTVTNTGQISVGKE